MPLASTQFEHSAVDLVGVLLDRVKTNYLAFDMSWLPFCVPFVGAPFRLLVILCSLNFHSHDHTHVNNFGIDNDIYDFGKWDYSLDELMVIGTGLDGGGGGGAPPPPPPPQPMGLPIGEAGQN